MFNSISTVQSQFKSLSVSFGVQVAPSMQARAAKCAKSVKSIKPGIYQVGKCFVNCWSGSCSCKESRHPETLKPIKGKVCIHHIAVMLSEHIQSWQPYTEQAIKYFATAGIDKPETIAIYCRLKGFKGLYRLTNKDMGEDRFSLEPIGNSDYVISAPRRIAHSLTPFFE